MTNTNKYHRGDIFNAFNILQKMMLKKTITFEEKRLNLKQPKAS